MHTAGTKSIAGCKQALPRDEGGARTRTDAPHSRRPVQDIGTVCTDSDALYSYLLSVASKIRVPANGPKYVTYGLPGVHGYFRQIQAWFLSLPCEYHKTSLMEGLQRYVDNQRQTYKSLPWTRDEVDRKIKTRSTSRIHKNEWNTRFHERANYTVTPAILQLHPRTISSNDRIC